MNGAGEPIIVDKVKIDHSGRILLNQKIRDRLGIQVGDELTIKLLMTNTSHGVIMVVK